MELKHEFEQKMISDSDIVRKKHHYYPSYYRQLIARIGGVEAAKALLATDERLQEGLIKLWELKCLEYSMEALVLNPKYSILFTPGELKVARKRLERLEYKPNYD